MGRKKKNIEVNGIGGIFDGFYVESEIDENLPLFRLEQTDCETAQPCTRCGRYPRLHFANFKHMERYPNRVYIDCRCGECDGEWYDSKKSALAEWNRLNLGARPRSEGEKDRYDFMAEIMENYKIPL